MPEDQYPYLFDVAGDRDAPLSDGQPTTFGAAGSADVALDEVPDGKLLFRVFRDDQGWFVEPVGPSPLNVNQAPAGERARLEHLAIIQAGRFVFIFIQRDDPAVSTSYAANLWLINQLSDAPVLPWSAKATMEIPIERLQEFQRGAARFELPGAIELPEEPMLLGRDNDRSDIWLNDVRVSRMHTLIVRHDNTATITDLKSTNGTFVNGEPIDEPRLIYTGDRIQIGPFNLIFRGTALFPLSHDKNVQLVGCDLTRRVPDRANPGRMKVILDEVSLVIRPREFVCILGPSGSGKTTLLNALSARVPANEGSVLLNGESLYAHFEALKQNLAVVPQMDVLHDVLTLHKALWYTAKLRLPADVSRDDIEQRITEMLDSVSMDGHRRTPIRRLSGGQVKRASWVNEAISNPSLIFLDEVTSGLDEQTDSEMMQLFRRMADEGKTIVCVTHSLSYVEQNCHQVAILAPGGVLAFFGPPDKALAYFNVARLGDIYQRLTDHSSEDWKKRFRESRFHDEFIARRMPAEATAKHGAARAPKKRPFRWIVAFLRQLLLLTRRYFAVKWADRRALAMMLGQSLFIAVLLVWLFGNLAKLDVEDEARRLFESGAPGAGSWEEFSEWFPKEATEIVDKAESIKRADYSSKLLFLLCIVCIWFGCNNSAKEIVKERNIFHKERDVGVQILSYYGSKLLLLGGLTVIQASVLFWIVRYFTQLSGNGYEQWLVLSLAALVGVTLGLAISAIARSEDLAVVLVPILLIPQIIFGGLIAPLLNNTRVFSELFISTYWAYQGALGSFDGSLRDRLKDADLLYATDESALASVCSVLASHIVILAIVALMALYAGDIQDNPVMRLVRRLRGA